MVVEAGATILGTDRWTRWDGRISLDRLQPPRRRPQLLHRTAWAISAVIGVVIGRLGLLEPHGGRGARAAAPQPRPEDWSPGADADGREPSGPAR